MNINYITNSPVRSGVGGRAHHILSELQKKEGFDIQEIAYPTEKLPFTPWPGVLGSKSINWVRWGKRIKAGGADVHHITNQTLSFIARRLTPCVVTVHDIIEILEPQTKGAKMLNTYLYSGIPKAAHIISVSEYTKQTIIDVYGVSASNITVIPNAADAGFYPIEDMYSTIGYQTLREELRLADHHPIVLYVGSDHPRKNLPVALQAFSLLKQKRPDALFIKIGEPGIVSEREKTIALIEKLGITDAVRFVGSISTEKLNMLYNCGDVLVFPSRFEGFGLPPLEAMAAGTPVICANTTSLPEVVGDAAITHDPDDVEALATALVRITEDVSLAKEYARRGLARSKTFSWKRSVEAVAKVYNRVV